MREYFRRKELMGDTLSLFNETVKPKLIMEDVAEAPHVIGPSP
jgi:hypothetical protein